MQTRPTGRSASTPTGDGASGEGCGTETPSWAPREPHRARPATNLDLLCGELRRLAARTRSAGLRSALEALAGDVGRGEPVAGALGGLARTFRASPQAGALHALAEDARLLEDRR